ncbi:MAG: PQQ-binding-like beta-propeller repeat protein [Puniceicoccaceae bacterium]
MKETNRSIFYRIAPSVLSVLLLLIVSSGYAGSSKPESVVLEHLSGDEEIDQIRRDIRIHPTDESNYQYRAGMARLWEAALGHQGAVTGGRFYAVSVRPERIEAIQDEAARKRTIEGLCRRIDDGYRILEAIQKEIREDPSKGLVPLMPDPRSVKKPVKIEKPWPQYQGTLTHVGSNGTDGPVYGRVAWDFPVGLAWESRPVVEGDKVYLTSPGVRNMLFTLDINTGEVVGTAKKVPLAGSVYSNPATASSPILLKDHILIRELGSRGNTGPAKEVVFINKKTGEVDREVHSGHVDYRAGYAPLAANEKYMVYPFAIHELETTPPEVQAFSHVLCKDTKTGALIRDIHIGQTFAEPLLEDNMVYIGGIDGYVYGFDASEPDPEYTRSVMARDQEVTWEFKADGAVNRKVAVDAKQVYFGANDGSVYCLDKKTGKLIWKYTVKSPVAEAFRHFSTPLVSGKNVFIGSADKTLYCLDTATGKVVFKHASSDWIRARPVATDSNVYFASMNGDLYNIDYSGKRPKQVWKKRIGEHWIYADLALSGNKLLINDSDLYSYCVDTDDGEVLWRFSVIKSFYQEDGYRVYTDRVAGGTYYQSKAIAANGQIFIGTPSRFIYSLDAESGEEIWKYEIGAAISGAPIYDNNKIYIGQQGGEDDFYCLDAKTGELVWKQNIGWVWGSAAVGDGLVFIPGIDGFLNCLDADTGHIIWRYRTDKSVCSEPMVMGDHVYFGSWDTFLYKFDKRSGVLVWKYSGGGSDSGVTIGFDGKLVLPGAGMTCIDAETKELIWKPVLEGSSNGTPAFHDGQVFVSMWSGELVALDAESGERNWSLAGASGITAPVVGENGYVYSGARGNPYFSAYDKDGNDQGATDCLFRVRMANGLEESTPALYRGRAYVLSGGGYFYAIE